MLAIFRIFFILAWLFLHFLKLWSKITAICLLLVDIGQLYLLATHCYYVVTSAQKFVFDAIKIGKKWYSLFGEELVLFCFHFC